jgi:hypothetical protein
MIAVFDIKRMETQKQGINPVNTPKKVPKSANRIIRISSNFINLKIIKSTGNFYH